MPPSIALSAALRPVAIGVLTLLAHHTAAQAQAAPADAGSPVTLAPVEIRSRTDQGYKATDAAPGILGDLKLIDTPFSINVLNRALIEDQQANRYGDYLKNDPGVTIGNVPVGFLNIRGFGLSTDGYLYDGLPGVFPLSDGRYQLDGFERIEVLKGATSVLYGTSGASSVGGVLNFVPKRALATPVRDATLSYQSQSLLGVSADIGNRFGTDQQFGYRLNLGFMSGEQAVDNTDWRHRAAALALDWRVTSNLVLSGNIESVYNHYPTLQPFFVVAPGTAVPRAPDVRRNLSQPFDDFAVSQAVRHLRADWQLSPDWSLTGQALHSRSDRPRLPQARFGVIGGAAPGDVTLFGGNSESKSGSDVGQVTLRGKFDTGSLQHQLSVSALATRSEQAGYNDSFGFFPSNLYRPVSYPLPASASVQGPIAPTQDGRTRSVGFTDVVRFSEQWSVVAGLRQVRIEQADYLIGVRQGFKGQSATTPLAALVFKPAEGWSVYGNYAEGLEQGGTAPVGTTNADRQLGPRATKQVELGVKRETAGLLWTAALFDMRRPLEYVDATNTYVQRGTEQHRGLELTAQGQVAPALSVVAGLTVMRATSRQTGEPLTEGKRPSGVPKLNGNVYLDYKLLPGLSVNGGLYGVGPQFLDDQNTQRIGGYVRVDAGLRYETKLMNKPTVLRLNVENLAGKDYWAGANSGILTLADPRTFKLSASFSL